MTLSSPATAVGRALAAARSGHSITSNQCDHYCAEWYGLPASGYLSAQAHWVAIPAGLKHSGPVAIGGLLYWRIGRFGHTAIHVGNGNIVSPDIIAMGRMSVVKATLITARWGAVYEGWAQPWFHGDTVKLAPPVFPPPVLRSVILGDVQDAARRDPKAPQGYASHPNDTRQVEAALLAEGLLDRSYAGDGSFGTKTVEAYAAWQRRCGYSGADADGIPGMTTLRVLGAHHGFTVH